MEDLFRARHTTILADLGPLPEVTESNSDTCWRMFLELQKPGFAKTQPAAFIAAQRQALGPLTAQDLMAEARRMNRVCPRPEAWRVMCTVLREAAGSEPPAPILAPQASRTPPLVKRVRLRDQVEWAERHGQLELMYDFMKSLAEDEWTYMRM